MFHYNGLDYVADPTRLPMTPIGEIREMASEIILAKYPLWAQINYANGIYPATEADTMKAAIASVIAESNRCEDIIEAGGTATPNWPTL